MKKIFLIILLCFSSNAFANDTKIDKYLDSFDNLYRNDKAYFVFSMKVKAEYFERTLKMEGWAQGEEKTLIKILEPKKESGTTTLKVYNDIWNYLPKINKVIKIPSSMMGDSWMGSHFNNDDLVKESRFTNDFNCDIKSESKSEIILTCVPNDDAIVVWGLVDILINKNNNLPMKVKYFDEDKLLVRTMYFEDVKVLGGKLVPAVMRMVPEEDPNEYTMIKYEKLNFDIPMKSNMFSIRSLKAKSR